MAIHERQLQLIHFSFYGTHVSVETDNRELIERIQNDFIHFKVDQPDAKKVSNYQIQAFSYRAPPEIPSHLRTIKTKNSIMRQAGKLRYNDYSGEATSIYNYENQTAQIFSENLDRLHEITYLVILSRTGKHLDLQGFHRIHAMGLSWNHFSVLCMMPTKGGKTTLFLHALQENDVEFFSDDSPIINKSGSVLPFPVRVGLIPESFELYSKLKNISFSEMYEIDRMRYGRKLLIPTSAIKNKISAERNDPIVFLRGVRTDTKNCKIKKISAFRIYPTIFINMVIGLGLPMMAEYFLERNWRDFFRLAKILVSRFQTSIIATMCAQKYEIQLGTDPHHNAQTLKKLILTLSQASQSKNALSQIKILPHS